MICVWNKVINIMIKFSILNVFEQGYFTGIYIFVGDYDGTGSVDWNSVIHWAK